MYKFNSKKIYIGINLNHFHKMLKSIKKKDSITLFINNDNEDELKLGICVEQSDENNKVLHVEQVAEIANEPNYEAVLSVLK